MCAAKFHKHPTNLLEIKTELTGSPFWKPQIKTGSPLGANKSKSFNKFLPIVEEAFRLCTGTQKFCYSSIHGDIQSKDRKIMMNVRGTFNYSLHTGAPPAIPPHPRNKSHTRQEHGTCHDFSLFPPFSIDIASTTQVSVLVFFGLCFTTRITISVLIGKWYLSM